MRQFSSLILLVAIALGACAPAQTSSSIPAAPPPAAAPALDSVAEPSVESEETPPAAEASLTIAPDDWWLRDLDVDGMPGISVERAYRDLLADREPRRTVVVAVLDSGIDIEHEDLDDNLWVNPNEVPTNGVDDDGNGYPDDTHGWSFLGGPDGRNVHQDTYEVTRLYAACLEQRATEPVSCAALEAEFEEERSEAIEILTQYRAIAMTQERITALLSAYLDVDSLTYEMVADLQTLSPELRQAQQIYLQMIELGATPEVIEEGIEALSSRVEYGFNLEFDPRPIVGDDYEDVTERFYGNNDVTGPAAEHGTHVAGIIGAERGNGIGMDGVANSVALMSVRTVPDGDERDKDVANAIRYAVDNGAHIINMSFGKGHSPEKATVDEAVRYAEANGVLLVHAAGNDGEDLATTTNYPNRYYEDGGEAELWIEVGASGWNVEDGLAAPFSNYGADQVDIFAPGVEIYSAVPGGGYTRNQGTSMAAPVVSGVAALLMAYFPDLTPSQVREIILDTAVRFPGQAVPLPGGAGERRAFDDLSVTGGIVNAYEAVRRAIELEGTTP